MKDVLLVVCLTLFSFSFAGQALSNERGVLVTQSQTPRKRTALVIGNSAYESSPLRNPTNDATDMAEALRDAGFAVTLKTDLNQNDMKRSIREFGQQLRASGGVGLFYFAGHGVQSKGVNYLIPIGANINTEEEVEYESVEAGFVLAQMESAKNELNIVILDACRNNPFARSFRSNTRGLAQMDAPSGTLIAYATAPGSVASDGTGRNGLYTQEILNNMKTAGLGVEELFKRVRVSVRGATQGQQTPWESSSLIGDFVFVGSVKKSGSLSDKDRALAMTHYNDGQRSFYKQQYVEAIASYTKAISIFPDFSQAYYDRGVTYANMGNYDAAIVDLDKSITLYPDYSGAYYFRGFAYHSKRDFRKAIIDYTKSLELDPSFYAAYINRALAYEAVGDKTSAANDRAKAAKLSPK
jgi:tetratricopeptide (TPR) repeat protein